MCCGPAGGGALELAAGALPGRSRSDLDVWLEKWPERAWVSGGGLVPGRPARAWVWQVVVAGGGRPVSSSRVGHFSTLDLNFATTRGGIRALRPVLECSLSQLYILQL